jgi:serine/threonine protein kinase
MDHLVAHKIETSNCVSTLARLNKEHPLDLERVANIAGRLCAQRCWSEPVYIDNGASAAVYKVETPDGPAALKVYDPAFFEGANALIEANRIDLQRELKGHRCPHLVDVRDAGELAEDGTWYLLMEYCPWKSLDKRLSEVPDAKVHDILKQLVKAVQFLDTKGLVHRDIKPANIVVSDDFQQLKLLDFGVMRRIAHDEGSGTDAHKFIATAQYSPPEFLAREEVSGAPGFLAINVYQIGAVLHDLITKTPLFAEEKATRNKFKLFKAVTERRPRVVSASVPPRLIALCLAALDKDPAKRTSSVTLDDFHADVDDLDALRRRVAQSDASKVSLAAPTLASWRPKVRSWGREAAQLEAATLGAVRMRAHSLPRGQRWQLDFAGAAAPIFLDLVLVNDSLAVHVLSSPNADRGAAVFHIGPGGPDLPETGIPGALAGQYLYALDLALAIQGSAPSASETLT